MAIAQACAVNLSMSANERHLFGAVEAGGTKFVLAIGRGHDHIVAETQIPTTAPGDTLQRAIEWFQGQGGIAALGIASFGPVDLDPASPTWGCITDTPKPGWSQASIAARLGAALGCPVGLDTDVNGAAIGEFRYGAAKGCNVAVYVTVGTGIGGGAIIGGETVKGCSHPEMGHVTLRRHPQDLDFAGVCSVHGDCIEGLASGPAIKARWGTSLSELTPDHIAHEIIADYLAQLCQALIALYSPQRVILGGGSCRQQGCSTR
jgi:fructokinase